MLMSKYESAVDDALRSNENERKVGEELTIRAHKLVQTVSRIAELERELGEHEQESYSRSSVCFEMLKWYEVPQTTDPEGKKDV